MNKLKLGIIGAGWVAKQHLEVISSLNWIRVVGMTSRTRARAEVLAKEYSIPYCFDTLDELMRKGKPDALMVLVSDDQVFTVSQTALEYRVPLFIEKPAGLVPEDNLRLLELAHRYSVPTMVGLNRRFYSIFHKGLNLIRSSMPLMAVVVEGHERIWRIYELKKFSKEVLDNWIFANSIHTIDLLRFFGGEPKDIMSIAHKHKESLGDQFAAIMEFDSGAIGQYSAYWYSPGGWKVVLYGNGITVEFKPLEKGFWTDKDFNTYEIQPDEVDIRYKPGFYRQMEAFGKFIFDGKKEWPMQDLEGAYGTMCLAKELTKNLRDKLSLD